MTFKIKYIRFINSIYVNGVPEFSLHANTPGFPAYDIRLSDDPRFVTIKSAKGIDCPFTAIPLTNVAYLIIDETVAAPRVEKKAGK